MYPQSMEARLLEGWQLQLSDDVSLVVLRRRVALVANVLERYPPEQGITFCERIKNRVFSTNRQT